MRGPTNTIIDVELEGGTQWIAALVTRLQASEAAREESERLRQKFYEKTIQEAMDGRLNGATFIPEVSEPSEEDPAAWISWTVDKDGFAVPDPVNIRGPQGIQGEPSYGWRILGYLESESLLAEKTKGAEQGDAYLVHVEGDDQNHCFIFDGTQWRDMGAHIQGPTGMPAGFGEVTAEVGDGDYDPVVTVTTSGPDTAKNFHFAFDGLKAYVPTMEGCTYDKDGKAGIVPQPKKGQYNTYLSGSGQWRPVSILTGVSPGRPLDEYTWQEVIDMSYDAKANPEEYKYMIGQWITLPLKGYKPIRAYCMDIGNDVDEDGDSVGLEFFVVPQQGTTGSGLVSNGAGTFSQTHNMSDVGFSDDGYRGLSIRSWLNQNVLSLFPTELQDAIREIEKYGFKNCNPNATTYSVFDKLWMLSASEFAFGGKTIYESVTSFGNTPAEYSAPINEGRPYSLWQQLNPDNKFSQGGRDAFYIAVESLGLKNVYTRTLYDSSRVVMAVINKTTSNTAITYDSYIINKGVLKSSSSIPVIPFGFAL